MADFLAWQQVQQHDDIAIIRPGIHNTLQCAAMSLNLKLGRPVYFVSAEPSVVPETDKRLAGEVVFMCIKGHNKKIRILLEVKGSSKYPYNLQGHGSRQGISQMLEEVALSFNSDLCMGGKHSMWFRNSHGVEFISCGYSVYC
jgi:hypothetical protein